MCWVSSDEPPTKRRCRCGLRRPRPRPIFPPVKRGLAHHGIAVRSALTCNGHVQVRRRRYENIDGSTATLTDELIDLADCGVSLEARRKGLKRSKGLRRHQLRRGRGADQRYKEMKLVTMYDQEKEHRLVRATRSGVKRAGRMLRDMSADCRLRRAQEVAAVTDGAE